ncbi:MAG TPA: helix-turn-helix domain-containing protein [Pyrinomonadaceae bacterium]|nr:helix-turn-helix domain-containing protein [Pyrinomonadaceae bacterium]
MSKQVDSPEDQQPSHLSARMAGEERRLQILRVAMRLFAHRGFSGTTTKEIAQAAGVSEAMVFRHFATKDELYDAILDQKACDGGMEDPHVFLAEAIKRKDDRAVFETLALRMMRHHEQDTEFLRLLTHSALEGHQFSEMFWDRVVTDLYEFLGGYVRERQRDGAFRNIDPAVVVRAFVGMVIHHSLNNTLWDKKRRLLDIDNERAAREFTDILLSGITDEAKPRHAAGRKRTGNSMRRVKETIRNRR